jgi:hypothetical protein
MLALCLLVLRWHPLPLRLVTMHIRAVSVGGLAQPAHAAAAASAGEGCCLRLVKQEDVPTQSAEQINTSKY